MDNDLEALARWIEDLPEGETFAFDVEPDADDPAARAAMDRAQDLVEGELP